jgi:hypothetical protein
VPKKKVQYLLMSLWNFLQKIESRREKKTTKVSFYAFIIFSERSSAGNKLYYNLSPFWDHLITFLLLKRRGKRPTHHHHYHLIPAVCFSLCCRKPSGILLLDFFVPETSNIAGMFLENVKIHAKRFNLHCFLQQRWL